MHRVHWWQYGLVGGATLSLATLIKLVRAIAVGLGGPPAWGEAGGFAAAVFAMGFLCGLVVWVGRDLYRSLGMAGDAIVGVSVMVVFFVCCMLLFEPALLGPKFPTGGAPMLTLAIVIGIIGGPWFARDIRREYTTREIRDGEREEDEPKDNSFLI